MPGSVIVRGVAAGFGARSLFTGLDLVVDPGSVIGLVGPNGAGKSTLLRMLAGEVTPEQGTVTRVPVTAAVGYLAQEPDRIAGETLAAFLARRTGVSAATERMELAGSALAEGVAGADEAYSTALEQWLELGGADLDERVPAELDRLGLDVGGDALMTSLSGGQAARAGLASLLLARFDVFALDEPTNDLDLAGLELLEQFVTSQRAGVVVVSHDREFLARTVTEIVELDLAQRQIARYSGGYQAYLDERQVARRHAREAYEQYAQRRSDLDDRARTQRNWMEHGVRNARRKMRDEPDKNVRRYRQESTEKQASKARQTERMIERLEVVEEPRKEWELRLELAAAPRAGSVVAVLDHAVVRRGPFTLGPVDLQVDWGDRIAVTGPNGGGKTTLLRALLGELPLDSGRSWLGPGVVVGGVDQARTLLGDAETLPTAFARLLPEWADGDVRTLLAKFGLRADHVTRTVATLSPGERTRAALALLQARGTNLLVLDEPTNHLDLPAIEQLEQALEPYPGTLVLVSHDRRLLDTVRVSRRLVVGAGAVTES
ncbi:ABC-F family ATP-binding cassette domain-containing protein [Jatrophihabitans endophyticus]|uniref:ABC-F family ATP-binding cassette domain-containing protein n=1 Tax=Jatrophihabitans endophyticus TaxID=1206085 RepID=UPI0019FE274A|nr:ABC-F family ATP-binding cassette domain-containing protein [Jatrophihabitans endophyticus]MBE7187173.1 ABC-F family ATP-binding cassette domain-containing protein [Jatrophihabitans endophyticus]